eukprot:1194179-Prorocentrum_minimum.AAC.3
MRPVRVMPNLQRDPKAAMYEHKLACEQAGYLPSASPEFVPPSEYVIGILPKVCRQRWPYSSRLLHTTKLYRGWTSNSKKARHMTPTYGFQHYVRCSMERAPDPSLLEYTLIF